MEIEALRQATLTMKDPLADGYRSLTEIRSAYRRSLTERDAIAAHLVREEGWTLSEVAHAIRGVRHHTDWAETIVTWTEPSGAVPDAERLLYPAQQTVEELRELHSLAAAKIQNSEEKPLAHEGDALERLMAEEGRLQQVRTFHDTAEAARDVVGANLVAHHGWRPRQVAALAGAEVPDITAAYEVARLSPPSEADTEYLLELAGLTDHLRAATAEQAARVELAKSRVSTAA
ncbi:hypothetical protein HDA40_006143 [Hamadaea flava]|uniref:DUF222 domain-containing protein n=1 Tax=Hamadaea flava TaxID=1742688 RepID=A0ABV8LU48_9ACTN|nr:hypothetical protein [Hamadaea flava]MCP2327636.1 hypothetical protein [Hamadaea flava]